MVGATRPLILSRSSANPVFTVSELSEALKLSPDTIRRIFQDEPGVIVITRRKKGTRVYRSLRIPEPVVQRKLKELTNGGGQ